MGKKSAKKLSLQQHYQLTMHSTTNLLDRGYSGKDFIVMAGKAAELLLKIMVNIGKNLGTSKMVSTIFSLFSPPHGFFLMDISQSTLFW